jgi:Ca2+-binding RTX toxin-like protein
MYSGDNVTVTGTTHLSARPGLDTSHPWATTTNPPPPPPPPPPGGGTGTSGNDTLTGGASAETINAAGGNDKVAAGGGSDTVNGGAGADTISGDAGDDRIIGGAAADNLTGGVGADRFVYQALSDSISGARDRILDFNRAEGDKIDLSALDANSGASGNQAFTFVSGYTGRAGQLTIVQEPAGYNIKADVNGDGGSDFMIYVAGAKAPVAGDFIL